MDETDEEVDLSNAPEKAPLDATVRHPDEVEEVKEDEKEEPQGDPEMFTVCDAATGTC